MIQSEVIHQRRLAVLEEAERSGNVAATCRIFGIFRTRLLTWPPSGRPSTLGAMPISRQRPLRDDQVHRRACNYGATDRARWYG